ncbi:MAG: hypothetical protein QOD71_1346, partial [Thermoleophilaceae bacterium]|nr:hypothetical protein [Thermoleophilaceae bacterium]
IAAAALPAVAEARVVEPVSVTGQVDVPAGQSRSLTLKCPAHAVALNGTSTSALDATSSTPGADARRWTFGFTGGASGRAGGAILRCVRLRLPRRVKDVGLAVETRFEPVFEVPPGATQTIDIRCSHGNVPTGWGLERNAEDNGLSIAAAVPTKRGWSFTVENTGATGAAGSLSARCLERRQRASTGQRHAFSTRIASFTEQIEGSGTTSRSCQANEYSVATGVSLPASDDIRLTRTLLVGERGGEWSFAQAAGATAVTTNLVCLRRTTGFHR